MQALKYSPPQGSFFTRPDSKALIAVLLTPWHRPRCPECHWPHTLCCRQPQILAAYHLLTLFLWYPVPATIHERCRESSISWAIWACKLVCLPGVTLEKNQETWLPTCDFAWFWGIYYSAKPSHPVHSFGAWPSCLGSVSEALIHDVGSVGKRLSILGARRIVLLRFLILSGDQDLLHRKREDGIRSWAWRRCSRY